MKKIQLILSAALLSIGLNASANDSAIDPALHKLDILNVAPCESTVDVGFTEMVTTMASVLPPAEADALLARYCDECHKMKFNLSKFNK